MFLIIENLASKSKKNFQQRAGALYFGNLATQVFPLTTLGDPASKQVQDLVSMIGITPGEQFTSFTAAFGQGIQQFLQAPSSETDRKKVMVVFTDGLPDEPGGINQNQAFAAIKGIYDSEFKPNGIEVIRCRN